MTSRTDEPASDSVAAIIVAAGASARMDGIDKIWADLDGIPVIQHSLRTIAGLPQVTDIVLVAPADRHDDLRGLAGEAPARIHTVEGGARRQDSVARGIAAAPEAAWYLVHDGARPLATVDLVERVLQAAREHGAAVPGVAVHDAIKRIDRRGRVVTSVDRSSLRAAQTPQAFAGPLLRRAHATVHATVSDDAAMVEALAAPVQVIDGDPENLKITTPADLDVARLILARRRGAQEA